MKPTSIKAVSMAITILTLVGTILGSTVIAFNSNDKYVSEKEKVLKSDLDIPSIKVASATMIQKSQKNEAAATLMVAEGQTKEEYEKEIIEQKKSEVVYNDMTLGELSEQLDRTLTGELAGQGYTFASYAVELGIDPYLAVAIVMHETGCEWQCSSLLRECNNVGGMKAGGNGYCYGYASFASLEDGIRSFMNNLYNNYFAQGLTTPEAIGPKYAASTTWASQVNAYINKIKAA